MPFLNRKIQSYNPLGFIFSCQILTTLGWVSVYPYGGQVSLILWASTFLFFLSETKKHLVYALATIVVILYTHIPREYGPPNNQWNLNFLIFSQLFYFDRQKLLEIIRTFCDVVLLLCIGSLIFKLLYKAGIIFILREFQVGPQIFKASWPFYVDRINITKDQESSFLFDERFHGPFLEPGALGICLGLCLFLNVNIYRTCALIIFGSLTMSMSFAVCLFLSIADRYIRKQIKIKLVIIIISLIALWPVFDNESFFYRSTYGRILNQGDKILNTRLSYQEIDQIELYDRVMKQQPVDAFWGVGWDTPGSGGSYRSWILGAGLLGTLIWFIFLIILIRKNTKFEAIKLLPRIGYVILFLYTFGNWLSPLIVLIFLVDNDVSRFYKMKKFQP